MNNTQPSKAIFWQNISTTNGNFGYRNGSTTGGSNFTFPINTYIPIKISKRGNSITVYAK